MPIVRDAQIDDLERIVELHAARLPHGFFARLGSGYLRAYHRTFIGNDSAVSLVTTEAQRVSGFLVGAVDVDRHRQFVLRHHGFRLAAVACLALLRRPALAIEFARTRFGRYARGVARGLRRVPAAARAVGERPPETGIAVLTHVAVDPTSAARGAGTGLVRAFEVAVRRRGGRRIELLTLAGPAGAGEFYRRLGWRQEGQRSAGGVRFDRFVLDLR